MRLVQTQVCPVLRYLEATAPSTAASRSASSKTMNGALPHQNFSNFGGAGEGKFFDDGIGSQLGADFFCRSGDDVENAFWNAGAFGKLSESQSREGRLPGRFQYHSAACGDCRPGFAGDHGQRKIPRRDASDDADGLF